MRERLAEIFLPSRFGESSRTVSGLARDGLVLCVLFGVFYGLIQLTRYWSGPVNDQPVIHLNPAALPLYAFYSVSRLLAAYTLSLGFALIYAYVAAHSPRAERVMIPILDTLQSVPVLSFLPPVMMFMISLLPSSQLGLELGSIVLIATGQVWNMVFSVYASMKNIPRELREGAQIFRLSNWQRFSQLEFPYSAIGLIWNSMMSMAGGWFFLMACETFVLGKRDLRLPGLGSYLQTAANTGNTAAILYGVTTMILVIVLFDQLVWRPMIAWAERFKLEQVEEALSPRSPILNLLRQSRLVAIFSSKLIQPLRERVDQYFARKKREIDSSERRVGKASRFSSRITVLVVAGSFFWLVVTAALQVQKVSAAEWVAVLRGAGATFLRVELVILLAGAWTVPVGIFIGLRPSLTAAAQPVAQIAASVPATALFPIVLLFLIRAGGGLGVGSILLLLLGTQWYLLFNVIAGATAIPTDLKEVCHVFRVGHWQRWKTLFLPGIFPYLVTGLITASGGAWNASIVAEYFHFRGEVITTVGLGSVISQATDSGNFRVLMLATIAMTCMVTLVNRLLWRRMYSLALTKYSLNG